MRGPFDICKPDHMEYELFLVNKDNQQPKENNVRHTPMDLYVKEYLLRAILVAFDQSDTKDDVWDMALVSPSWKMYCDGFGIEFIKEKTDIGFLVTVFKDEVRVNRRDDENGISTKLNDEANEIVCRYIRSCYKPIQSPATPVMKMAVMFYAGKETIVSDVEVRVFKDHLIHTLIVHNMTKDHNVNNYIGVVLVDKIVITHCDGDVYTMHYRPQEPGWEVLYREDWNDCALYLHETYSIKTSEFCDKLNIMTANHDTPFVYI